MSLTPKHRPYRWLYRCFFHLGGCIVFLVWLIFLPIGCFLLMLKLFQRFFPRWYHKLAFALLIAGIILEIVVPDYMDKWDTLILCIAALGIISLWVPAFSKGRSDQGANREKWRIKLYRFAADTNFAEAQLVLGNCYATGDGVPQDYVEAVKLWRKAAERNDAQAQFNLGTCYHYGTGVEKDVAEAVEWYRKAAESGDVSAQLNLGACYATGDGVPQDEVEGYKWFLLAAGQGYAPAKRGIAVSKSRLTRITVVEWNKIKENIAASESRLTPEQIEEGQKLACEFKLHKAQLV